MQRLFECVGERPEEARRNWAVLAAKEFFDGDPMLEWDEKLQFTFEKSIGYPISLTRFHGQIELSYRRAWRHIRTNKVGVRIIWFVRHGTTKIVRSSGTCVVEPGEFAVLDSNFPYYVNMSSTGEGTHESFLVTVPSHFFEAHCSNIESFDGTFSLMSREGKVVQRLLDLMAEEDDSLTAQVVRPLAEAFLRAIGEAMGCTRNELPRRQSLGDRRIADIRNYITMNATDSELSYDKVAASCGISSRYLCYLLKANNTSFSEMLWKCRIESAREWLVSPRSREYSINEIAFMSGFKSAAHFSRMFKSTFGCPPNEYRSEHALGCVDTYRNQMIVAAMVTIAR